MVSACAQLQELHLYHGDLRPQSVLIGELGQVKLAEYSLVPGMKDNFVKGI